MRASVIHVSNNYCIKHYRDPIDIMISKLRYVDHDDDNCTTYHSALNKTRLFIYFKCAFSFTEGNTLQHTPVHH